jgi:hypothetical protein
MMIGAMKSKTASERRHHDRIAQLPCIACGRHGVHVHHVVSDGFKRISKNHMRVVPLCPDCHLDGKTAVHRIDPAVFNQMHGFDLLQEAERLANG